MSHPLNTGRSLTRLLGLAGLLAAISCGGELSAPTAPDASTVPHLTTVTTADNVVLTWDAELRSL